LDDYEQKRDNGVHNLKQRGLVESKEPSQRQILGDFGRPSASAKLILPSSVNLHHSSKFPVGMPPLRFGRTVPVWSRTGKHLPKYNPGSAVLVTH
jgi:hypothetical protein